MWRRSWVVKYFNLWHESASQLSSFNPPVAETQLLSSEMRATEASLPVLSTTDSLQEGEMGKILQGKFLKIVSPESPAKLYCCYGVITVLTVAVVVLSVALSVRPAEEISIKNIYTPCPSNWIGVGNKCFYFSEYSSNWTSSQDSCMEQEAQLARIDSQEELNFLRRYKGIFDHWIGLHRESSEHPWKWTDNTEYNNSVPIQGVENYAYLNSHSFNSARVYVNRRWICSKLNSYSLYCQIPLSPS
ncbi:C-type lectin domain family 2 member D11-like [Arvicanthis niloticus]|uniref:C-type lectin domain family 2 member D11-like n=1 Tax=Arvicanthis niloticus TaxID=61156 RepID=UPI0014870201|nr:C-type lectin domain family 2 member D11-like [Arvicanthis niloticus]